MKTILLIRHAKSSWDSPALSDFDRPLNGRGKRDAPEMAKRLAKSKIQIDLFISSPAKRAKKTAELFIGEFKRSEKEILFIQELYQAPIQVFYDIISGLNNTCHCAAIFSHNPGITDFANTLTEVHLDNIPTCGVFAIKAPVEQWNEFDKAKKEFLFFDYPKSGT